MNKTLSKLSKKIALCLTLSSAFIISGTSLAGAQTYRNDIVIEGNASGLVTIPDEKDFLIKDNFMPGDKAVGTIKLTNNYDYSYEVFLRADDIEKQSDVSFAKQLKLHIDEDGDKVYDGELQGEDKMSKEISLGVINPGETRTLNADVVLDGVSTTNEYKNKYASVQWIFTAERTVESEKAQVKKTSDMKKYIGVGVFCLAAVSCGAALILNRRRGKCGKF